MNTAKHPLQTSQKISLLLTLVVCTLLFFVLQAFQFQTKSFNKVQQSAPFPELVFAAQAISFPSERAITTALPAGDEIQTKTAASAIISEDVQDQGAGLSAITAKYSSKQAQKGAVQRTDPTVDDMSEWKGLHGNSEQLKTIAAFEGSYQLAQRRVLFSPSIDKTGTEEGSIVVDIVVDEEGKVIEASPNGRGSTSNSELLRAKAKAAALATRFSTAVGKGQQHGTIKIDFIFQ